MTTEPLLIEVTGEDGVVLRAHLDQKTRRLTKVVLCSECVHGTPERDGNGEPAIECGLWHYHDSPRGRQKRWPFYPVDHYCAKGERTK